MQKLGGIHDPRFLKLRCLEQEYQKYVPPQMAINLMVGTSQKSPEANPKLKGSLTNFETTDTPTSKPFDFRKKNPHTKLGEFLFLTRPSEILGGGNPIGSMGNIL